MIGNLALLLPYVGPGELLLILAVVLLLFGARKLPELARGFGQSIREFRKATREGEASPPQSTASQPSSSERHLLIETAKRMDIDVEGKSLEEIAEEMARRGS